MTLEETIHNDLTQAMKAKDQLKTSTLRMLIASMTNLSKSKKKKLTESDVIEVAMKEVKKRREAATAYKEGNRPQLEKKELAEMEILQKYLPKELNDDELKQCVADAIKGIRAIGKEDMGQLMSVLMPKLRGRADGRRVSKMAEEMLSEI